MPINRLEAISVLKLLDILADTLSDSLGNISDKELKIITPSPFAPASEDFATAADKMSNPPFTAEEAEAAIAAVREAIEENQYAHQVGSVVNVAAKRIKELATLLFV